MIKPRMGKYKVKGCLENIIEWKVIDGGRYNSIREARAKAQTILDEFEDNKEYTYAGVAIFNGNKLMENREKWRDEE